MSQYTPGQVPLDAKDLPAFLGQELFRISRTMTEQQEFLALAMLHNQPKKYFDGMVVLADGTNWNPGAGAGYYGYYNNAWNKLG